MKKTICFFLLSCALLCAVLLVVGLFPRVHSVSFNPETEGILDVVVQTAYGEEKQTKFFSVSAKGCMEIPAFTPDAMEVYRVPHGCFESYIDGKVLNRLVSVQLLDERGKSAEITDTIEAIFHCIERLEHDLLTVKLFKLDGMYFVYVELNVNLWTPCTLYYYAPRESRLYEVDTWDNMEVIGIHIRDMQRIATEIGQAFCPTDFCMAYIFCTLPSTQRTMPSSSIFRK